MTSGVYEILNTVNGKRYIGSAVNLDRRHKLHWSNLRTRHHINPKLQAAWNKHGEAAFKFNVMLTCEPSRRLAHEQHMMDMFKPDYNIATVAGAPMSGRKHSAETRARIALAGIGKFVSAETRRKKSDALRGRKLPAAQVAAMAQRATGRQASVETKAKMSAVRKGVPWSARRRSAQEARR